MKLQKWRWLALLTSFVIIFASASVFSCHCIMAATHGWRLALGAQMGLKFSCPMIYCWPNRLG